MQYITKTHSGPRTSTETNAHTLTYTKSETRTHRCFVPWASPVNNTKNRRGEQGNKGEEGWGNRRYISRNAIRENFKKNYGDTVAPLQRTKEEYVEPNGQTEGEKRGVMNTCKLRGRRHTEREGYKLASGYVNEEVEAFQEMGLTQQIQEPIIFKFKFIPVRNG